MSIRIPAWVDGRLVPVEKLDVHRRGLRHKAVSVFVMDGDAILMQRRAAAKYHTPGLWTNTCCTHPAWDEGSADCAARRLREELGIGGVRPVHRGQVEYRAEVGGGLIEHEVVEIYTAEAGRGLTICPDPEEVDEVRWIPLARLEREIAECPKTFTPWLRIYLERFRDTIFGEVRGI